MVTQCLPVDPPLKPVITVYIPMITGIPRYHWLHHVTWQILHLRPHEILIQFWLRLIISSLPPIHNWLYPKLSMVIVVVLSPMVY